MARAPMPVPQNYQTSTGRRSSTPAPQIIETPTMRRSAMLAKLLEEQRQPVEIKGGYGELAARLLGQGITQFSANRAESAAKAERQQQAADQADAYALQLAGILGNNPPPSAAASTPTPMPTTVPMPSTPASTGPTAPVGEVVGSNLPNVGQPIPAANVPPATPVPPVEAMPQPTLENALLFGQVPAQQGPTAAPQITAPVAPEIPQNPLMGTSGEGAAIQQGLEIFRRTGDPAIGAWVNGEINRIRQRMDAPAAERMIVQEVGGVPYYVDPAGVAPSRPVFGEQGIPDLARTRTVVAGPNDPLGMTEGTTYKVDSIGNASVVRAPSPGYRGTGAGEAPIRGGPQDPAAGGNLIQNERELRREYQGATEEYRTVRQAFQKVEASLGQNTGIGDVGGIFGVMKIFDPGSTVREGEAATVQNSGGVPETIRGLYNRVVTGERLTPAQRAEIVAVGRAQFGTYEQGYQGRVADFTRMAEGYGIDPRNVVGSEEAPAPRPQRRSNAPTRPNQPASRDNDPLRLR
jgi:hypothetical protein